jgi:hypothetical protein
LSFHASAGIFNLVLKLNTMKEILQRIWMPVIGGASSIGFKKISEPELSQQMIDSATDSLKLDSIPLKEQDNFWHNLKFWQ